MLHVRVVCPTDVVAQVLDYLTSLDSVINVIHLAGAARKPDGDLVTCDVAREDASILLAKLAELGCEQRGTIALEALETSLSLASRRAERAAHGHAADAVVWEEVTAATSESAELSVSYVLFMVLASLITSIAILTDSTVLLIGGMVVGPEFGPLAGICVALVQRRPALALRSAIGLIGGFSCGIVAAAAFTAALLATGHAPPGYTVAHPETLFISRPDAFAGMIALLAGVAGMYSLTTVKPGALIGVFISVTTIPAAANIGVASAYRNVAEVRGAALQLSMNVALLVIAGMATLAVQRLAFRRRLARRSALAADGNK